MESFQTSEDTITKTLNGQVARQVLETIRQRTVGVDPITSNPLTGTSDEGFEAGSDFRQLVTRWVLANPKATLPEIEEQVTKFGKQITDRFKAAEDFSKGATYDRDPNLPFENPYADQQQQPQGSADPQVQQWEKANGITEEQRKRINDQAAQSGLSYEEFVKQRALQVGPQANPEDEEQARRKGMTVQEYQRWKLQREQNQPKAPDGTPINKTSFDPNHPDMGEGDRAGGQGITPEQAASYIDRAFSQAEQAGLSDDERTNSLLDLIGQGESKGNYNAVYGNINNQRDLSQYSVDDILGQQQYVRDRGIPSTAVGKYGFLYKTLKGLKAELGLSGNEKFTPALQEQMARHLLNRRGLQAYRAGRISKATFALSLSQEFASLPNPNTGRSFYAGDGLNASQVSRQQVYQALGWQPVSLGGGGDTSGLRFNHPEQASGVNPELKSIVAGAYGDLGLDGAQIISGYRSPDHPAERGKASGGGEHTHGDAMDVSMEGLSDQQRSMLVQSLIARGAKRFITYSKFPDMLHVDLKDQTGNGQPYFMHNKSAKNLRAAPSWFKVLALGNTV